MNANIRQREVKTHKFIKLSDYKNLLFLSSNLLYILFSYSYKSLNTLEIPLSIPMTMHTATYRLFMYQDENEPEGKNSCLALK